MSRSLSETFFTPFKHAIDSYSLPQRFTFPFYYRPHPLCVLAVQELQVYLDTDVKWQHDFGIDSGKKTAIGKMFGVLLVQNEKGAIGYLSAFSGKIADSNHHAGFVPPVFDMLAEDGFFRRGQDEITQISNQIKTLEENPDILKREQQLKSEQEASKSQISAHRKSMIEGRKNRKEQRLEAEGSLSKGDFILLKEQLSKQSIKQKNQLRDLTLYWNVKTDKAQKLLSAILNEINELKDKRKVLSTNLQHKLFDNYQFLNKQGVAKNLCDIFSETPQQTPPAGAGECAAPKLLNHAFKHNLKPLALAYLIVSHWRA